MRFKHAILFAITWLCFCAFAMAQHPSVGIIGAGDSRGSGVMIAKHPTEDIAIVMTAKHVIADGGNPWINFPATGKRWDAIGVQMHPNQDLAFFSIRKSGLEDRTPMPLWTGELTPGMACYSEGFGAVDQWDRRAIGDPIWIKNGIAFGRLKGKITGTRFQNQGITSFSLPSIPGDSGSAIFVAYQGKPYLVGITSTSDWVSEQGHKQSPTTTTAPTVGPVRQWLQTIGWRVRRARSQADYYTYRASVEPTGCIVFGRGTLFGRNHPAPYGGPQCIPGRGCQPQGQQQQPRQDFGIPPMESPPMEIAPTPGREQLDPRIDDLLRKNQELMRQQERFRSPPDNGTYSLPGRLRADFDTTKLKQELLDDMAGDPRFRGQDGRDGADGRPGVPGDRGPAGQPGEAADEKAIAARVAGMINIPAGMTRGEVEQIAIGVMDSYQADIPINQIVDAVVERMPTTPIVTQDPTTGERTELGELTIGETFTIPFKRGAPSDIRSTTQSRHIVLVADKNANYWPALSQLAERAKGYYAGLRVAEPPEFAVALPQIVGYRDGLPIKPLATGYSEVSALLTSIVSNRFEENW